MNALIPLHFDRFDVRWILREGDPWWVLADVCRAIDIKQPATVAKRLDDDEKGIVLTNTLGGQQKVQIVSEPGMYKVVGRSVAAVTPGTPAHRFLRWLTHEVLPSIRQHGCYPPPEVQAIDVDRWEDMAKTKGQRFHVERLLWEQRNGRPFVGWAPVFTKSMVAAIERDDGKLQTVDRLLTMIHAEMDVLYILTGRRAFSSRERLMIDQQRMQQLTLLN